MSNQRSLSMFFSPSKSDGASSSSSASSPPSAAKKSPASNPKVETKKRPQAAVSSSSAEGASDASENEKQSPSKRAKASNITHGPSLAELEKIVADAEDKLVHYLCLLYTENKDLKLEEHADTIKELHDLSNYKPDAADHNPEVFPNKYDSLLIKLGHNSPLPLSELASLIYNAYILPHLSPPADGSAPIITERAVQNRLECSLHRNSYGSKDTDELMVSNENYVKYRAAIKSPLSEQEQQELEAGTLSTKIRVDFARWEADISKLPKSAKEDTKALVAQRKTLKKNITESYTAYKNAAKAAEKKRGTMEKEKQKENEKKQKEEQTAKQKQAKAAEQNRKYGPALELFGVTKAASSSAASEEKQGIRRFFITYKPDTDPTIFTPPKAFTSSLSQDQIFNASLPSIESVSSEFNAAFGCCLAAGAAAVAASSSSSSALVNPKKPFLAPFIRKRSFHLPATSISVSKVIELTEDDIVEHPGVYPVMKLLKFHQNYRPEYRGTHSRAAAVVSGRKPLAKEVYPSTPDYYDNDSDEDWDEEMEDSMKDVEELDSDGEKADKEEEQEEDDDDDGFLVPHGYLSESEREGEVSSNDEDSEAENEDESVLKSAMKKAKAAMGDGDDMAAAGSMMPNGLSGKLAELEKREHEKQEERKKKRLAKLKEREKQEERRKKKSKKDKDGSEAASSSSAPAPPKTKRRQLVQQEAPAVIIAPLLMKSDNPDALAPLKHMQVQVLYDFKDHLKASFDEPKLPVPITKAPKTPSISAAAAAAAATAAALAAVASVSAPITKI